MLRDDLKWKNSFDTFCLENNIQGEKRIQLTAIYGRAVFDILYSKIYHEFVRKSLYDFHQDSELDLTTLSTHIHNLYHEDLFYVPPVVNGDIVPAENIINNSRFAFRAIGDGEEIRKLAFSSHKKDLQSAVIHKEQIVCMFKIPDNLKWFKDTILWNPRIHKGTELYKILEQSKNIPSSFHIDLEKQENTVYKVTNSPFIR